MGFFQRLKEGLKKTSDNIANVFKPTVEIDEDFYDELEETLISADMGFETTEKVIDDLREKVEELGTKDASQCKELVMNSLREQMHVPERQHLLESWLLSIRTRAELYFLLQQIHLELVLSSS